MNIKEVYEKMIGHTIIITKKIGAILIIVLAIGSGFIVGKNWNLLNDKIAEKNQYKKVYSMKETSVALNEKNQFIIIDKNNGNYKIYEDSIGMIIFNMYAKELYVKKANFETGNETNK